VFKQKLNIPPTKLTKYEIQNFETAADSNISSCFIAPSKNKSSIKSFRLSELDLERLNKLVITINKESRYKKYSEAETLRCMIHFCSSIPIKRLLKYFLKIE
jgi:hypothetical protein